MYVTVYLLASSYVTPVSVPAGFVTVDNIMIPVQACFKGYIAGYIASYNAAKDLP